MSDMLLGITNKMRVLDGERGSISREVDPQWLHDGHAGSLGLREQCVPVANTIMIKIKHKRILTIYCH